MLRTSLRFIAFASWHTQLFAADFPPKIAYIFPNSKNYFGIQRSVYNLADTANITWYTDHTHQELTLECNIGITGTGPPWTEVWGGSSSDSSGGGSFLFSVDPNNLPPRQNTCRFVLAVSDIGNATIAATAYSPDLSIDIDSDDVPGIDYPFGDAVNGYHPGSTTARAAPASTGNAAAATIGLFSSTAASISGSFRTRTNISLQTSPSSTFQGAMSTSMSPSAPSQEPSDVNRLSPAPTATTASDGSPAHTIGIGVAIGVAAVVLAVVLLAGCLYFRRKRRKQYNETVLRDPKVAMELSSHKPEVEMFDDSHYAELEHPLKPWSKHRGRKIRDLAPGRVIEIGSHP